MFLSNASVRRPIAMACLIIGLVLLGGNAYRNLGLELMPKVDIPFVTVLTVYPGASPEEIEGQVAKKIEDAVGTIDGLKHVTSSCMENVCQTLLEFELAVNVDVAATDVREKIDRIVSELPADAEDPTIQKFDINAQPIIKLALTGDAPLDELYDFADNTLRDRLTVISGVADVSLIGGAEREVQVLLDRERLAARGLTSLHVSQALGRGVRTIPSGRVRDSGTEISVKFDAEFDDVAAIADLPIVVGDAGRVRIRDVGEVRMATAEVREAAWIDGRAAVAIRVVKKADGNAVSVTGGVREALAELQDSLPGGMELVWVTDDGRFIEETNNSAWLSVGQGILLTAAVLLLFLLNLRSLLVVGITMPVTIIIGLFFMLAVGFTLNVSTLIALGMSVGVLVTNSIVVVEAIVRRLDEIGDPKEAARIGAAEVFVAVLASAGTNIVVLFPLATMGSMVGLFIEPLALTMFIVTVVSLFVSFTLTPLLCSVLLKPRKKGQRGVFAALQRGSDRFVDSLRGAYQGLLRGLERRRWAASLVVVAVLVMLVHSLGVASSLGFGFFPDTDKGELSVKLEYPLRHDLARTRERVAEVEDRLRDVPELKYMLTTIGRVEGIIGQTSRGVHLAEVLLRFSERDERELTIRQLIEAVRERVDGHAGALVTVAIPSIIGGVATPVEIELSGERLEELDRLALRTRGVAEEMGGLTDVDTTVRGGKPELRVVPRREVLADTHLAAVDLGMALRANLEGIESATYRRGARSYDIVTKLEELPGQGQVGEFLLPGEGGQPLALGTFGALEVGEAPSQITRKDKRRVSKLYAQLGAGTPLGSAIAGIEAGMAEAGLPPGYELTPAGDYEVMAEGMAALGEAGLISLVLVILSLAAILESFRQPFLILVTVPLALIGMFWGLGLAGLSMGIFEVMGAVIMVGIVVNNAILIVDRMNELVASGTPRHEAMIHAAGDRFRPVIMITFAAVLGMMPLAFSQGIGAEMRNGVGIASMAGILVSGLLTLFVVPVLYDLMTRGNGRRRKAAAEG